MHKNKNKKIIFQVQHFSYKIHATINLLFLFNACPIGNHVVGSSGYPLFKTMHKILL
jgi:hypothetical protein